jgi:hypothetical protein
MPCGNEPSACREGPRAKLAQIASLRNGAPNAPWACQHWVGAGMRQFGKGDIRQEAFIAAPKIDR